MQRVKRSFDYKFDRRTITLTVLMLLVCAAGSVLLDVLYTGGFFSAWFVSFVMALIALMVLSIPRRIVMLDNTLEIQCIFEITEIDVKEIASINKVDKDKLRWAMPLFVKHPLCPERTTESPLAPQYPGHHTRAQGS